MSSHTFTFFAMSWAVIVQLLHGVFVAGLLIIPFTKSNELKRMEILILLGIMAHWALNDNTCLLTELESWLTGKPVEQGFLARLIHPIYDVTAIEIWIATLLLLLYLLKTTPLKD